MYTVLYKTTISFTIKASKQTAQKSSSMADCC